MVVFSTSPGKRAAVEALGAQYINSKDAADMAAIAGLPHPARPPARPPDFIALARPAFTVSIVATVPA